MERDVIYFFSDWSAILRIVVIGSLMYAAVAILLRLTGSRTLASLNVFDFIVTVAIGAAFGRALTAKAVSFSEAITAFLVLVGLQYLLSTILARWSQFSGLTNAPSLLYYKGRFNEAEMRRERLNRDELLSAVRKQGIGSLSEIDAIVLESSGGFSIIRELGDGTALSERLERAIEELEGNG